jgi:superfamily II DNA/RNA helicase
MQKFKKGEIRVLVCADAAGIVGPSLITQTDKLTYTNIMAGL